MPFIYWNKQNLPRTLARSRPETPRQKERSCASFSVDRQCHLHGRDWCFIAEQPAPAPHLAHPEGCAALRIVLVTVPRVSRSCEHFPDGFDLHLLHLHWKKVSPGRIYGLEFRAQGSRCRVQGSGCKVQGSQCRVHGSRCRVQGSEFRVQGSGSRVHGLGFRVQGSGFRVQGRVRPCRAPVPTGVGSRFYRGTSLIRNSTPLKPYRRTMPRALGWSQGFRGFLMSEVPL